MVLEQDADSLAFLGAKRGTGHAAVVGPCRKGHTRRDLYVLVLTRHFECSQRPTVWQRRNDASLPVCQHRDRVEAVRGVVHFANRDHSPMSVDMELSGVS